MAPNKLKKLSKKRSLVKESLFRFEEFLDEVDSDPSKCITLSDRLGRFETVLDDYEKVQSEIDDLIEDDPKQ